MKTRITHKLVLLIDDLIQIKNDEIWESTTTPEQEKELSEIINSLDQLWFTYRNQVINK